VEKRTKSGSGRKIMVKRIAITGPESTGKTWLTNQLALHFNTIGIAEYAREYINKLQRPYCFEDIEIIAKQQLFLEETAVVNANKFLFIDTDFFVTKIWSEFVFHKCSPWILNQLENHNYDLHLLCNIDLPWEYDPQREHPHKRKELFDFYKNELDNSGKPYFVVSGTGEERLNSALEGIKEILF
jgi:NadR type nicotinamide-nucleotide adenylyltransferase